MGRLSHSLDASVQCFLTDVCLTACMHDRNSDTVVFHPSVGTRSICRTQDPCRYRYKVTPVHHGKNPLTAHGRTSTPPQLPMLASFGLGSFAPENTDTDKRSVSSSGVRGVPRHSETFIHVLVNLASQRVIVMVWLVERNRASRPFQKKLNSAFCSCLRRYVLMGVQIAERNSRTLRPGSFWWKNSTWRAWRAMTYDPVLYTKLGSRCCLRMPTRQGTDISC